MLNPLFSKVYYKGGVSLKQVAYGMTYGDYAWTVKKPYILKGSASKTTYTTKKKALTVSLRANGVRKRICGSDPISSVNEMTAKVTFSSRPL